MALSYSYISFLSDFGLADEYVGVCKGVIARIAPDVKVIDISHEIFPQSIREGANVLERAVAYLPLSVHLAVVDPGVGSKRRPVIMKTRGGSLLVGPDNGLLWPAAERLGGLHRAWVLHNPSFMLSPRSNTFHGRDVFAPAAAHLAAGVAPERLGPQLDAALLVKLSIPPPRVTNGLIESEVVYVDRFGNLQLNVRSPQWEQIGAGPGSVLEVETGGKTFTILFGESYADVAPGEAVVVEDSAGYLSLSINMGDAAKVLLRGKGAGEVVRIRVVDGDKGFEV